ncbi:hypothetical protein LP417_17525 [Polaromonas sp. P1-6]|nr:hypothetical protein LP417_17525 [Polaromonas sp. P1-6]
MAPATFRQALNALRFLYKQVLGQGLPWMQSIGRPSERKRVRIVLTANEVQAVLALMDREGTRPRLLYGTGMRLAEGLNLRVPIRRRAVEQSSSWILRNTQSDAHVSNSIKSAEKIFHDRLCLQ